MIAKKIHAIMEEHVLMGSVPTIVFAPLGLMELIASIVR